MSDGEFAPLLKRVAGGEALGMDDAARAFGEIMEGRASETEIAAFLTALAVRRPTVDEIVGAATAMRARMNAIEGVPGAIDLCGTGGDGLGTLNISTAVSFVVAGAGVPVAKHGNRNSSSKSGAADVLEALGARIDLDGVASMECLRATGLCFLFAQAHHPAMRYAAPVRKALGFRTIFNLLGPLANPAGVRRQLLGVFSAEWIEPMAEALRRLGTERAWVVHSKDGLDEISASAPTDIAELTDGKIVRRTITPEEFGITRAPLSAILGGTAAENAGAIRRLLSGEKGAYRDIVLLNAAAALCVGDKVRAISEGLTVAANSIDSGRALAVLNQLVERGRARA